MKCKTRDFGEIEVKESEILDFVQPPFGFDAYKKYVLLHDETIGTNIVWLQSIEAASVCFVLFDPSTLASFYAPQLPEKEIAALGEGELVCWVIAVIPGDFKNVTVNLKSPIIVNTQTQRGLQLILEQDYSVRHPLMKGAE